MSKNSYEVIIREILETKVSIPATSKEDSLRIARKMYYAGKIILMPEMLVETEFESNHPEE